jgi:hypothetical protein
LIVSQRTLWWRRSRSTGADDTCSSLRIAAMVLNSGASVRRSAASLPCSGFFLEFEEGNKSSRLVASPASVFIPIRHSPSSVAPQRKTFNVYGTHVMTSVSNRILLYF